MARRRLATAPKRLPPVLAGATTSLFVLGVVAAPAAADHGHGGSAGWYDASDPAGYHVAAREPGRPGDHHGQTGRGHQTAAATSTVPPYCVQAAAAMRVTGVPGIIGGRPVVCGGHATPAVTPRQLAERAWNQLQLPLPSIRTAPPRSSAGLVGLPEWVWVPREQWQPMTRTATAGAVWAQVTAAPKRMVIDPGAGLPARTCPGPGAAYDPAKPASAQHTDCSYTYRRSSAAQPQDRYRVRATVTWGGSWTGSDGGGGALPDVRRSAAFGLRVAEAQGLYG